MYEFQLMLNRGRTRQQFAERKFGKALQADLGVDTDIWDGADGVTSTPIWERPTQARKHNIKSTDAADALTGTGMQTMRIYGLKDWNTFEVFEDINLDGVNDVETAREYVIIYRKKGKTWGSGRKNAGIITSTAQTDDTITAVIQPGNNQSLMAIFAVPSGYAYGLTQIRSLILKASGSADIDTDMTLFVMENADQVNAGWIVKDVFQVASDAPLDDEYSPPDRWVGPAIIKMQVNANANAVVTGSINGIVVHI